MILGASGYLAVTLNDLLEQRRAELVQLYHLLLQLKSEIHYMCNPLPECFENLAGKTDKPFCQWFMRLSVQLKMKKNASFEEVWEQETFRFLECSALQEQDVEPVMALKNKLGNIDVEVQKQALDYALMQIEQNRMKLETEMAQKKKVVITLSFFAGFMTLILLF